MSQPQETAERKPVLLQGHPIKETLPAVASWEWGDISFCLILLDLPFQGQTPSSAPPEDIPGTGACVVRATTLPSSLSSLPNL